MLLKSCSSCPVTEQSLLYNLCSWLKSLIFYWGSTDNPLSTQVLGLRYSVDFHIGIHPCDHHSKLGIQHCWPHRSPLCVPVHTPPKGSCYSDFYDHRFILLVLKLRRNVISIIFNRILHLEKSSSLCPRRWGTPIPRPAYTVLYGLNH